MTRGGARVAMTMFLLGFILFGWGLAAFDPRVAAIVVGALMAGAALYIDFEDE